MEFKIYITEEEQPDALAIDSLALWNPLRPDDQGNKCGAGLNGMVHELNSWMSWKLLNNTELWTPTTVCHGILAEENNLLCRPHSYHFWKALATNKFAFLHFGYCRFVWTVWLGLSAIDRTDVLSDKPFSSIRIIGSTSGWFETRHCVECEAWSCIIKPDEQPGCRHSGVRFTQAASSSWSSSIKAEI